jgi:hypothetical protein
VTSVSLWFKRLSDRDSKSVLARQFLDVVSAPRSTWPPRLPGLHRRASLATALAVPGLERYTFGMAGKKTSADAAAARRTKTTARKPRQSGSEAASIKANVPRKRAAGKQNPAVARKGRTTSKKGLVITKISRNYLSPFGRSEVGVPLIRLAVRTTSTRSALVNAKPGKAL